MTTTGRFNFLSTDTPSSLYRNGEVMIRRDAAGNTTRSAGLSIAAEEMVVHNARQLEGASAMTCENNGFELQTVPTEGKVDYLDHAAVIRNYYPQCEALVSELTGAPSYAFDHNVRSAGGKATAQKTRGGHDVQEPAHIVHGDYTLRSGPERLRQLSLPPEGNDALKGYLTESLITPDQAAIAKDRRFAIINVWRNIANEPVESHPMALCDGRTVLPEDLVVFEIHYDNRIGENYFAKYSAQQRMYTYPQMTPDEALIIKQWDSAGTMALTDGDAADGSRQAPCTFSFHSAFEDPATREDAPDRWSIEVRCIVVYTD